MVEIGPTALRTDRRHRPALFAAGGAVAQAKRERREGSNEATFGVGLAPACDGNPEQERHEQACERRFPCDGADGRERLSRLPRRGDGLAQASDR